MPVNANIIVSENETLESALRRFKRAVDRSDVLGEIKRREIYITASQRERRKRGRAVAMLRRKQRRREMRPA